MILAVFASSGCKRRPLTTADYTVILNIDFEREIVNYQMPKDPSLMRCIFYDSKSGAFVTQAFLPPTGGQVSLIPSREYDVLVYNFDTESTWLEDENWYHKIYASTSLIPDSFRTKLRSRATKADEEKIVYDPDHLFVGRLNDVYIPSRAVDAPPVILDVVCETVVESWILEVRTVTGKKNIGSIAAVITGLTESNKIGPNERSKEFVSVYFDNQEIDDDGLLTAKFNTFGWNERITEIQELSLVFTDIAGHGHVYKFDVSNQFPGNKEQIIRINTEIDIPEPMTPGDGGFVPKVDEWDEINTDIII
ncbi:MAG: DUF5119 domain-containing protein [Candidatus Methanomethylophilaceae archaeon]|nr:DUF5119 domain-containing protein [Candidatus Methanomethylophilaceae archaeon]